MKRLLAGARKAGLTTFYPMGQHAADGSDTVARLTDTDMDLDPKGARKKTITPRFHKGSKDSEVARELKPAPVTLGAEASRGPRWRPSGRPFIARSLISATPR